MRPGAGRREASGDTRDGESFAVAAVATGAISAVVKQKGTTALYARSAKLYVYRTGLVEGVPGDDYLAWEIEVTDGAEVREFVYVDAHANDVVEQFTSNPDALNRRAFDGQGSTNQVPPNYPANPFWVEGQTFPTGNAEADNMIVTSEETYNLFKNGFGRDSFNGLGATMDMVFNRGNACPNASWNGVFISFCPGFTIDDITAHEWAHAYTQFTHGLIYALQPGALNESYSDIFGEAVDIINARDGVGNSGTDALRSSPGVCTVYTSLPGELVVNSPAAIAGTSAAQAAAFGPALTTTGITENVVVGLDASNASGTLTTDGCTALTNAPDVAGKIALVDRGTCNFSVKVFNAQQAGPVGVLVGNNQAGLPPMGSGINAELVTIPSLGISQADGTKIKTELGSGAVNVTMRLKPLPQDNSTRWLMGEDLPASLGGASRDMWNPTCYNNPGKVSDPQYNCELYPGADNGGVHFNSGIPNHAFALLVDGGTYNGQTIEAIGLTKALHVYYRAMTVYQVPNSNFVDHADSLEQSASDLITSATVLLDVKTGLPSGEVITAHDLEQIEKAMLAVEMRRNPSQCAGLRHVLDKNVPAEASCGTGTLKTVVYADGFETGAPGWTVSRDMTVPASALPRETAGGSVSTCRAPSTTRPTAGGSPIPTTNRSSSFSTPVQSESKPRGRGHPAPLLSASKQTCAVSPPLRAARFRRRRVAPHFTSRRRV